MYPTPKYLLTHIIMIVPTYIYHLYTTKTQYDMLQEKHSQMTNFLQNMKDPNSNQQKEMDAVLRGGRGQQKRLYSVDESIYGTEEGAKLQKDAHEKAEADKKKKNKKRRKKKQGDDDNTDGTIDEGNGGDENTTVRVVKQSVAAVAVVGALAAGASFLLGGKRS